MFPCPKPNAKHRLFCFPYAGGGNQTYYNWTKYLPENVELVIIQPPGRGARLNESRYTTMHDLVANLLAHFTLFIDKPYTIIGHSLGSRVGFELINQLHQRKLPLPQNFFASGSKGPHQAPREKTSFDLPEHEFKEELRKLSGTPNEILKNDELMQLILPIIRADFQIADTYRFNMKCKFPIRAFVFGGLEDAITHSEYKSWFQFFESSGEPTMFDGDHFFIDRQGPSVVQEIAKVITPSYESSSAF
ncbi:MAG: thioesterase domain-containing protein [Pseudoalteromonas sp.]|nr:thioesterase domain-containing protein [Pseudoalteromonas sp.]